MALPEIEVPVVPRWLVKNEIIVDLPSTVVGGESRVFKQNFWSHKVAEFWNIKFASEIYIRFWNHDLSLSLLSLLSSKWPTDLENLLRCIERLLC